MEKKLSFSDLFAMGLGFTIGGGVFTLTGIAMNYTGGSTFLAYIGGAIAIVFCMLPTILAGSIVPRTGVSYSLSKEAFSRKAAGFYFWIFFIGRIAMAANATAFAMFFTSVFTTFSPKLVGSVVVIVFFIANYFGMNSAVKVQKIMNYVLLSALGLFVIVGVMKCQTSFVFNEAKFFAGRTGGFFNAISLLVFSLGGGMSVLELGGMVEKPEKNLPKACFAVAGTVALLFAGIALATAGSLPMVPLSKGGAGIPGTLFFKGPNQAVINAANALFTNKSLLYFFIFGGACLALTTTINSSFAWYSAACLRASEDGWFPKKLTRKNKYGTPVYVHLIFTLFGVIPILIAPDVTALNFTLVKIAAGLQILCNVIPNFGLLSVPKLYPEQWEKSRFKMKLSTLKLVTYIPSIATIMLVYFNFSTYSTDVLYPVLAVCAFGIVFAVVGDYLISKKEAAKLNLKL